MLRTQKILNMSRFVSLVITAILISQIVSGQSRSSRYMMSKMLDQKPGYITINDLAGGIGLSQKTTSYSDFYYGLTTIHGYQISKEFILAAGMGFNVYGDGILVPVFLDFRYMFYVSRLTLYVSGDGGFLLKPSDLINTKQFINPALGGSYSFSRKIALNFSAGIFSQFEDTRDSFLNFKTGIIYKF